LHDFILHTNIHQSRKTEAIYFLDRFRVVKKCVADRKLITGII